jgi:hypothetical protein
MYSCYFRAVDASGNTVTNDFAVDDLVMCQTFNLIKDENGNTVNRYYWRRCVKVSDNAIEDENGDLWNVVCLSALSLSDYVDTNSTSAPNDGDSIVTVGNATDTNRQNVIILAAYGEGSPYIYQYAEVNEFSLSTSKRQ